MNGGITYEMLSAVFAAVCVVGGAWFFIERRIKDVEREAELQIKANQADIALLRETLHTKYVSNDAVIRLEERIVNELREMRRMFEKAILDHRSH